MLRNKSRVDRHSVIIIIRVSAVVHGTVNAIHSMLDAVQSKLQQLTILSSTRTMGFGVFGVPYLSVGHGHS